MLDTEVQLENAKANAIKYTNNVYANQGLNSQGYGSSAQTGIYNDYTNAVSAAKQNYNDNVSTLNQQQYTEQEQTNADIAQSIAQMASQAPDQDTLNKLYIDSGYGNVDDNGNFVFNGAKPEGMTDQDWNIIKYWYNAQTSSLSSGTDLTNRTYGSLNDLANATYANGSGNVSTLGEHFAEETKLVWHYATKGDYNNGDSIKIVNGEGDTIYLQWTKDGFKTVDENTYNASATKYSLTRNGKNKSNEYVKVS